MKLDVCSFQAPHCLTWTLTDGNAPCSLMCTAISGTCHVKIVQVIHEKSQNQFNHLFNCSVKPNLNNESMCTVEVILSNVYNLHCIQVPYNYGAAGLSAG